jgi:GDP-L-fucose synthase
MSQRRTVLVTGGTGLLGRAIRELVGDDPGWHFACSADGDLRSELQTDILFAKVKPTHVIHLAARVGGLFANQADNAGFLADNTRINLNVLEAAKKFRVQKVVSCLSTCVFPDAAELPLTAGAMHAGPPHASNEGYAHAKRLVEVMSRLLSKQTGKPFVCVVPVNLYGPNDNFDPETSHVVAALIHKACTQDVLRVRGTGRPRRQFLFSRDAARLVLDALDGYDDVDTPLMLAPPASHEISVRALATMVQLLCGCPAIEFDDDPAADGQFQKTAACATPDFEFTSLHDGLQSTIAWYWVALESAQALSRRR